MLIIDPPSTLLVTTLTSQVVTPQPKCIEKQESVFSVTGFLTFAVVSATAVSNVIANIDNNNNNNNNNDNNDNVNNNNQISDSADATNMGNARLLSQLGSSSNNTSSLTSSFLSSVSSLLPPSSPLLSSISSLCLPLLLCEALHQSRRQNLTPAGQKTAQVTSTVLQSAHIFAPFTLLQPYIQSCSSFKSFLWPNSPAGCLKVSPFLHFPNPPQIFFLTFLNPSEGLISYISQSLLRSLLWQLLSPSPTSPAQSLQHHFFPSTGSLSLSLLPSS